MRVAHARVLVAEGDSPGGGGARDADQPAGGLPDTASRGARRSGGRSPIRSRSRSSRSAKSNPTDGYRMVCCFVRRKLGVAVNRKRVLQGDARAEADPAPPAEARRRRPGVFKVERPGQLWHLDMTAVWVAEHGWVLPERDHRLLHPRDRRLGARAALPRRRGDRGDQAGRRRAGASCRARSRSAPTTAPRSPPAPPGSRSARSASRTAAAATATPRSRRSSRAGSAT